MITRISTAIKLYQHSDSLVYSSLVPKAAVYKIYAQKVALVPIKFTQRDNRIATIVQIRLF